MPSEKEIKAAVDAVAREDERAHDREYVASVLERGGWEEHVARTALSAAEKEREDDVPPLDEGPLAGLHAAQEREGDIIEKLRELVEVIRADGRTLIQTDEMDRFLNDLQEQSTGTGSEDLNRSQPKGAA